MVIVPNVFKDERGFFLETYQISKYKDAGIFEDFTQDNQSRSSKGILRGLHFQVKRPQAQILTVIRGCIFDVVVDLRPQSSTFGEWFGIELSDTKGSRQIYMAPGFAHGFCVMSDWADLHYKTTRIYDPEDEGGLLWNDPDVNINWPVLAPTIGSRDSNYPKLKDLTLEKLPHDPPIERT